MRNEIQKGCIKKLEKERSPILLESVPPTKHQKMQSWFLFQKSPLKNLFKLFWTTSKIKSCWLELIFFGLWMEGEGILFSPSLFVEKKEKEEKNQGEPNKRNFPRTQQTIKLPKIISSLLFSPNDPKFLHRTHFFFFLFQKRRFARHQKPTILSLVCSHMGARSTKAVKPSTILEGVITGNTEILNNFFEPRSPNQWRV